VYDRLFARQASRYDNAPAIRQSRSAGALQHSLTHGKFVIILA
jgi:hypothetical protein